MLGFRHQSYGSLNRLSQPTGRVNPAPGLGRVSEVRPAFKRALTSMVGAWSGSPVRFTRVSLPEELRKQMTHLDSSQGCPLRRAPSRRPAQVHPCRAPDSRRRHRGQHRDVQRPLQRAPAAALASTAVSDPLNHVLGGLQPFPPLHAANAPHAGHRGVAGGRAPAGSGSAFCAATARRGRPASCGRTRGGAGCCAPNPITVSGRRRVLFHLRDAFRADGVWLARPLRRHPKGAAVGSRRR